MTQEEIMKLADQLGLNITYIPEEWLLREDRNKKKDSYSVEDCILVRTTEFLPNNGVVETPDSANARMFYSSPIFDDVLCEKIHDEHPDFYEKLMSYDETPEEKQYKETYGIYGEVCRNTSHYTINGLVGSHTGNFFDGRGVIIIDPLEEHIDDDSLIGLRVEDTYFRGPVKLSKRAMLIIPKDSFIGFLQDPAAIDEMKSYGIFVFEGDEKDAVRTILNGLGYNAFSVNGHGYVDGAIDNEANEESKMMKAVYRVATEREISTAKHVNSLCYSEERERRTRVTETEITDHFKYVVTNSTASDELKEQMFKTFLHEGINNMYQKPIVRTFIDTIGLEEYSTLTRKYNMEQLAKSKSNVNEDSVGKGSK